MLVFKTSSAHVDVLDMVTYLNRHLCFFMVRKKPRKTNIGDIEMYLGSATKFTLHQEQNCLVHFGPTIMVIITLD